MTQAATKKTRPTRAERKANAAIKAQIAARVAPEPKPNPNAPKPRKPYAEGSPGFKRAQLGITLTAIKKSINEPGIHSTVMLDEEGKPTGEQIDAVLKPSRAIKRERRESFVKRGLLGPFATDHERRKTHRRNHRYAAVNTKGTKPSKKGRNKVAAPVAAPTKAVRK